MSDDILEGMPAACFVPVNRYKLRRLTGLASVTVPVRGSYPEEGQFSGTFDICPEPGAILFGTLTQVLLALGKYPTLAENQRFVMAGVEVNEEESTVTVTGRVIELL